MGLFSKHKDSKEDSKSSMPPPMAPPSPETPKQNTSSEDLPKTGTLSSPPVPGSSFNEIKNQISSRDSQEDNSMGVPAQVDNSQQQAQGQQNELQEDESLFDLSELDMGFGDSPSHEESHDHSTSTAVAPSKFMRNSHLHSHNTDKTYYITTAEFKKLLEIVESVKSKVKDSSERHLRLLDIKSEEDIEYENLKRDFEFIEDKLYEVDSLIFDK